MAPQLAISEPRLDRLISRPLALARMAMPSLV
jgi:hypothetical protein